MNIIKTEIKKWGNSQGIRLSQVLLKQLSLKAGDKVKLIVENEQVI